MRKRRTRSFDIKEARKDYSCLWCQKPIKAGSKYFSLPGDPRAIDNLLEEETGWDIYSIKSRTRLYYCDKINWKFCSSECMSAFRNMKGKRPEGIKERMDNKIRDLVSKIKDVIKLMTSLEGTNHPFESESEA